MLTDHLECSVKTKKKMDSKNTCESQKKLIKTMKNNRKKTNKKKKLNNYLNPLNKYKRLKNSIYL